MGLLDTIVQIETSTSIFNNDFSDNDHHQDQLYSGPAEGTGRTVAAPDPDVIPDDASAHPSVASEPAPPTILKKRGQPSKKAQVEAVKEPGQFALLAVCIDSLQYMHPRTATEDCICHVLPRHLLRSGNEETQEAAQAQQHISPDEV